MGRSHFDSRLRFSRRFVEELLKDLYEAIEGCLSVDIKQIEIGKTDRLKEIAV